MRRRSVFLAGWALVAAWCAATASGCRPKEKASTAPAAVRVVKLTREAISAEMRISATVREWQRVDLSFKVPGTVAEVMQVPGPGGRMRDVQEGDTVPLDPKRPLVKLDDSDYRRKLAIVESQLAQSEARQRALAASAHSAKADLERVKTLFEKNVATQQARDDAQARKDATEAELEAAQRQTAAAVVAKAQAEDDLRNCSLYSPIADAVVVRKHIEGNERVQAMMPVFQIIDVSRLKIAFGVPATRLGRFRHGQTLTVVADAFRGETFTGRVSKIAPAADLKTRTFEVEITVDQPRGLKPGMVVTMVAGRDDSLMLAPMTAVQRGRTTSEYVVYAVVDEKGQKTVRKRRVRLGGVYDNRIRIVEGEGTEVREGDVIVATGAFRLFDGQPVRVFDVEELKYKEAL